MKKRLQALVFATLAMPCLAFANAPQTTTVDKVKAAVGPTTATAQVNNGQITVESPRTGIRYTFNNPDGRPVVLETKAIEPATSVNADRIVASNPALSSASQQKAKQALLDEAAQLAKN